MIHLGIDFDDTLIDTRRVFIDVLNRHFGTAHTYDSARDYYLAETCGTTSAELERIFTENFEPLHAMAPFPGVTATLHRARQHGHQLTIITARPAVHMPPLYDWLARHNIQVDHVISAPKSGEKALRAHESGIDLFIDDNPRHALAIAARNIPVLMLNRPYNQTCANPLITRVPDWHAIAEKLFPTEQPRTATPPHLTQFTQLTDLTI